jgi:hypothetical protein
MAGTVMTLLTASAMLAVALEHGTTVTARMTIMAGFGPGTTATATATITMAIATLMTARRETAIVTTPAVIAMTAAETGIDAASRYRDFCSKKTEPCSRLSRASASLLNFRLLHLH